MQSNGLARESASLEALAFMGRVYCVYTRLMASAADGSLGGRLFYAGALNEARRADIAAANIAGAATLTASDDRSELRQTLRDGIIDFQVNSLDEALRILKNEIRKRQPVAVAVSCAPAMVENEMIERGVLPDLLDEAAAKQAESAAGTTFIAQGARCVTGAAAQTDKHLHIWVIPAEFARTPAALDALLLCHVAEHDHTARRWIELAPRYLGHVARRLRSIGCDDSTAANLVARLGPEFVF
jgi:urocanate hydratase